MDLTIGEKIPVAPLPEEKKSLLAGKTVFKVTQSKDELYAYIAKTPAGDVQSLLSRKVVPQQLVDADFLNRLATANELGSLKMFLGYAKESLLYIGLLSILKNASAESALIVISQLKTVPPKAPFELFKNLAGDSEGCLKVMELLIAKGWDPKARNDNKENLLEMAINLGHTPHSPLCQGLAKLGVA